MKPEQNKKYQKKYYQANKDKSRDNLRKRRNERAKWFYDIKPKLKCKLCDENHPACLDFHHRDSCDKFEVVSEMVCKAYSEFKILKEIEKCDVICSNCHRKMHANQRKFGKI